jgi:hypothetical protein
MLHINPLADLFSHAAGQTVVLEWGRPGPTRPRGVDVNAAVRHMLRAVAGRCQAAGGGGGLAAYLRGVKITI